MPTLYKVVETSDVTDVELERLLNEWTAQGWSFDGMVDDTRLVFRVTAELASADTLPSWRPGDEFEAARLAALAALQR